MPLSTARTPPDATLRQANPSTRLVVFGHPSARVRLGLSEVLRSIPQAALGATASTALETIAAVRDLRPDLLILAPEFQAQVTPAIRPTRTVLLAAQSHAGTTRQHEAACGFCSEQADVEQVREVLGRVLGCDRRGAEPGCRKCPIRTTLRPRALPLAPREQQVFELLGLGCANRRIAQHLGLGTRTVETYRENIKQKLGIPDAFATAMRAALWSRGLDPCPSMAAANGDDP